MGCCSSKNKCNMCDSKLQNKYIILSQYNSDIYRFCSEKCYRDLLKIITNLDVDKYQIRKIYVNGG